MHDQVLAFIKTDAMKLGIDGQNSYEVIAREFEYYWRTVIGDEVANAHKLSTGLLAPADPILMTIWKLND